MQGLILLDSIGTLSSFLLLIIFAGTIFAIPLVMIVISLVERWVVRKE